MSTALSGYSRTKQLIILLAFYFMPGTQAQSQKLEYAFTLQDLPVDIEGMTFDPAGEHFYFGENVSKRILRYTRSGKPAGFIDAGKDGITSLLGMKVSPQHHLWVCGAVILNNKKVRCIFRYDLNNGVLVEKYPDTSGNAKLFNDLVFTENGNLYITETYTKSLYTVDTVQKVSTLFLQNDSLSDGNGICAFGNNLYISTDKGITRVNTENKSYSLTLFGRFVIPSCDGLYNYRNSLIGVQNVYFPVSIVRYFLDSSGRAIATGKPLVTDHPLFRVPTTGAIVGNYFYFMANTFGRPNKEERINIARIRLD